jgi:hypothetical protein
MLSEIRCKVQDARRRQAPRGSFLLQTTDHNIRHKDLQLTNELGAKVICSSTPSQLQQFPPVEGVNIGPQSRSLSEPAPERDDAD